MERWILLLRSDPDLGIRTLLEEHGGLLYYAVRGVLNGFPDDDVEGCVTDVLVYVYRNRERLRFGEEGWKSYLVKTARHVALDKLRRTERLPEPVADPAWEQTAPERSAEEEALSKVERDELIGRIRDLGEPDSTILLSKYYLGLKASEIAALVGMKENTVIQRTGRALKRLAAEMKGGYAHA